VSRSFTLRINGFRWFVPLRLLRVKVYIKVLAVLCCILLGGTGGFMVHLTIPHSLPAFRYLRRGRTLSNMSCCI